MRTGNVTAPTQEMLDVAKKYADERTFQDMDGSYEMFSRIRNPFPKAKSLSKKTANIVGFSTVPFALTPANMIDRAINYTPGIGLVKSGLDYFEWSKDKTNATKQYKFVASFGRQLAGNTLLLPLIALVATGVITGGFPSGGKEKEFLKDSGYRTYAIKTGDRYYSYEWLQPLSTVLAMAADFYNSFSSANEKTNPFYSGMKGAVNALVNQSILQNVRELFDVGYDPVDKVANLATSPGEILTNPIKIINDLTDPYLRETYDPDKFKSLTKRHQSRIPFLSQMLPTRVDMYGQPIKKIWR